MRSWNSAWLKPDSLFLIRGQLRNQLHALRHCPVVVAHVRTRMEALDETLTAHIAEVEAELTSLLPAEITDAEAAETSPEQSWALSIALLQTIPGIGQLTAMWIVVATMNFTICTSAEQAAAYAGLAPMPHQSGTSVNMRVVYSKPRHGGFTNLGGHDDQCPHHQDGGKNFLLFEQIIVVRGRYPVA
jgi:hypothetical protein